MRILLHCSAAALLLALPGCEDAGNGQAQNISQPSSPAPAPSPAPVTAQGFRAWLPELAARARSAGVRQRTIDEVFPALEFSARTVQLDRAQPGGTSGSTATPPFAPYRAQHVSPALIQGGQRRYTALRPQLNEIGRR